MLPSIAAPLLLRCVANAPCLRGGLLLQPLDPMVVIVRDCRCERHVTWHPDLGQGYDERLFLVWGSGVADDPTFVTGIRQVRGNVLGLIFDGNMLRSQVGRQR